MPAPRILCIEDHRDTADLIVEVLEDEGFDVTVVSDGPSALLTAREGCTLLILDIGLPRMDGLEVCRRLRSGGASRECRGREQERETPHRRYFMKGVDRPIRS